MIEVRHLQKSFGPHPVLNDVSFRIENGESVVIIGRSGGGKSVLLKHLVGLLQPDRGEVLIDGENIGPMNERQLLRVRRKFGMVFQGAALFDSMTVAENVAFALRRDKVLTEGEITQRVAETLEMVDLPGTELKKPAELSGGMRKRASLARALALDPQLLFLDEPTAGLDPIGADAFDRLILTLRDTLGLTVVMITHDLDSLYAITDRIAVIADRKVVATAPAATLETHPHPWIRDYFLGPRGRTAHRETDGRR